MKITSRQTDEPENDALIDRVAAYLDFRLDKIEEAMQEFCENMTQNIGEYMGNYSALMHQNVRESIMDEIKVELIDSLKQHLADLVTIEEQKDDITALSMKLLGQAIEEQVIKND